MMEENCKSENSNGFHVWKSPLESETETIYTLANKGEDFMTIHGVCEHCEKPLEMIITEEDDKQNWQDCFKDGLPCLECGSTNIIQLWNEVDTLVCGSCLEKGILPPWIKREPSKGWLEERR